MNTYLHTIHVHTFSSGLIVAKLWTHTYYYVPVHNTYKYAYIFLLDNILLQMLTTPSSWGWLGRFSLFNTPPRIALVRALPNNVNLLTQSYIHTYINKYISEKNTYKGKHMNLLEQYMYLCMHVWMYVLHCVCIWLAVGVCGAVLKRGHEVSLLSGANSPFHLVHWSTCIHKCICSIHIIHKFIILPNNRANLQYSRLDEYWLNCRTNTHTYIHSCQIKNIKSNIWLIGPLRQWAWRFSLGPPPRDATWQRAG